jgi:hypothetical protein
MSISRKDGSVMSHFSTLVILAEPPDDPEYAVQVALAPFDECMEVEPYIEECYCKNTVAEHYGFIEAERLAPKTINEYRKAYWAIGGEKPDWSDYTSEWQTIRQQATQSHPQYQQFNPDCEECAGSGMRSTTANPKAKWDWWQIGGRWTGQLDGDYDPQKDIENQEWCNLCGGTGNRADFAYYADPENIEKTVFSAASGKAAESAIPAGYQRIEWCNGCRGKGLRVKWPTKWAKFDGDIKPVNQITLSFTPYAIVTPEGEWLGKGEMGWFGMSSDEKGDNEWRLCVEMTLEKYLYGVAVLVDCHI